MPPERLLRRTSVPALLLGLLLAGGLLLAWLTQDAPIEPGRARGLLRADALSALVAIVAAGHGLEQSATRLSAKRKAEAHDDAARGDPVSPRVVRHGDVSLARGGHPWRTALAAGLTALAALMGHLGLAGALLVGAAALVALIPPTPFSLRGRRGSSTSLIAALLVAGGLALIGLLGGEWRYGAPGAGRGLNSVSVALILGGALLACGAADLARGRAPTGMPLVALGALYALLRLFSLGPWNLGWLFAAMLAGAAVALAAAWGAAAAPPEEAAAWLGAWLGGLALAGVGLGSGAGVVLAGFALLLGPALRLGLHDPAPARSNWLLSTAAPLGGPFVAAWLGVAAAAAGGLTLLAVALWGAALLAALPAARLGAAAAAPLVAGHGATVAAMLSAGLGLLSPLVVLLLLQPVAAQLQGGLTPFGAIELWPWAGLIALDAARQPVATLPSLALVGLMLVLSALCWLALRLGARRAP